MESADNLYDILEITEEATQDEIKKAYRKLSKENHPDVGGNEDDFKDIAIAYDILSKPERRAEYDATGKTDFKDPFIAKMSEFIQHMLIPALESNPDFIDPIDLAKDVIKESIVKAVSIKEKIKSSIKALEKKSKKVIRNDGKDNLVLMMINVKLKVYHKDIINVENELELLGRLKEDFSNYSYDMDKNEEDPKFVSMASLIANATAYQKKDH
jgi:DnaJ-class molecular chaperone